MSKEQRALVRHIYSEITSALEVAHALATEGQRPDLKYLRDRVIAQRILNAINNASTLAEAVVALSAPGTRTRASRSRPRNSRSV
jgi:hypothetical protein